MPRQNLKRSVHCEKFACLPILVRAVREVPSDNEGHFTFGKFDLCQSVGVRLVTWINHEGRILANLEGARPENSRSFVLGHEAGGDAFAVGHTFVAA